MHSNYRINISIKRKEEVRKELLPAPKKTYIFRFSWWNGGGKIRMRLKTNPELRNLLKTKPDMFVYGEAETPSPCNLQIDGYCCYLQKSKIEEEGNFRRGLAIFYLTKYRFLISPVYTSNKYDIV